MQWIAEDKNPQELNVGDVQSDVKLGTTCPVVYFVTKMDPNNALIVEVKERAALARCHIFISPHDMHPSAPSAVWQCTESYPYKRITILPMDPRLPTASVIPLYIAIQFANESGNSFVSIAVSMREVYKASWYSAIDDAFYEGEWKGKLRHGKGKCLYEVKGPPARYAGAVALREGKVMLDTSLWLADSTKESAQLEKERQRVVANASDRGSDRHRSSSVHTQLPPQSRNASFIEMQPKSSAMRKSVSEQPNSSSGDQKHRLLSAMSANRLKSAKERGSVTSMDAAAVVAAGSTAADDIMFSDDAVTPRAHLLSQLNMMEPSLVVEHGTSMYDGQWVHGVREGYGIFVWGNGMQYHGEWKSGRRHGQGILVNPDGTYYKGSWENDARHGLGEAYDKDNEYYKGHWDHNKRHGNGLVRLATGVQLRQKYIQNKPQSHVVVYYPDRSLYEGEWSGERRNGKGKFVTAKGSTYDGEWVDDARHGEGTLTLANGTKFSGEWKHDRMVLGNGSFVLANGDRYRGGWDDQRHMRHGSGVCTYKDGTTYTGDWVNDERHGTGMLRSKDGTYQYNGAWKRDIRCGHAIEMTAEGTYTGEFSNNVKSGQGKMVYANGDLYTGSWSNGVRGGGRGELFVSRSRCTTTGVFVDGCVEGEAMVMNQKTREKFVGTFSMGLRHGPGEMTFANGDVYCGSWKNDECVDGVGKCQYANGDVYDGEWVAGKRSGEGVCVYADGTTIRGEWLDDHPCGAAMMTTAAGDVIEAQWESGKRVDGYGKCLYADGTVYEGQWAGEKPHGTGQLLYTDGTIFSGTFRGGRYVL